MINSHSEKHLADPTLDDELFHICYGLYVFLVLSCMCIKVCLVDDIFVSAQVVLRSKKRVSGEALCGLRHL